MTFPTVNIHHSAKKSIGNAFTPILRQYLNPICFLYSWIKRCPLCILLVTQLMCHNFSILIPQHCISHLLLLQTASPNWLCFYHQRNGHFFLKYTCNFYQYKGHKSVCSTEVSKLYKAALAAVLRECNAAHDREAVNSSIFCTLGTTNNSN